MMYVYLKPTLEETRLLLRIDPSLAVGELMFAPIESLDMLKFGHHKPVLTTSDFLLSYLVVTDTTFW